MENYLDNLPTPALVVDVAGVTRNCRNMKNRMAAHGVLLRPHMKTAKTVEVGQLATDAGVGAITVSTLAEAAFFAEHGFLDITYAVVMAADKIAEAADVQRRYDAQLTLLLDNVETSRAVAAAAARETARFATLIEIDTGDHRTGVDPCAEELIELGKTISAADNLELRGVLTHAGQAYECKSRAEVAKVAEEERRGIVLAAERLRQAGFVCDVVSAGSTPTAVCAESLEGITEMRPGNFVYFDLFQHGLGVCGLDDIAASVLATVIGHSRAHNHLIVGAGGIALSKDKSANRFFKDAGFGWVVDALSGERIADLRVGEVDQEHGFIVSDTTVPFERIPIGSRVRILPNHSCMTAAAYSCCYAVDAGAGRVEGVWRRVGGWRWP